MIGDIINETGDVSIENVGGSINVSGEIRAQTVNIEAGKDFNLNTDDWLHTNRDPRQYLDYDALRDAVFNEAGNPASLAFPNYTAALVAALDDAIYENGSSIVAQGRVAVTARYLNINGLIQSGVNTITLHVSADFSSERPRPPSRMPKAARSPASVSGPMEFRSAPTSMPSSRRSWSRTSSRRAAASCWPARS